MLATRKTKVIGIHVDGMKLHSVVAQKVLNGARVINSFSVPIHNDHQDSTNNHQTGKLFQKQVVNHRLRGKPVVLSVPNNRIIVRYLQMPDIPEAALRQAVEVEIGTTIHLPFEDAVIDVKRVPLIGPVQGDEKQTGVLLVATPRSVVTEMVRMVKQAGLVPMAVDIQPLALARAGGIEPHDPSELMMIAQIGEDELCMSIFVGSNLYFVHNVEIGIRHTVNDSIRLKSAMSDILIEITRVTNFFNFNLSEFERPIGAIYVHTQHPRAEEMIEEIQGQISTTVHLLQGTGLDDNGSNIVSSDALIALGLSMKRG